MELDEMLAYVLYRAYIDWCVEHVPSAVTLPWDHTAVCLMWYSRKAINATERAYLRAVC